MKIFLIFISIILLNGCSLLSDFSINSDSGPSKEINYVVDLNMISLNLLLNNSEDTINVTALELATKMVKGFTYDTHYIIDFCLGDLFHSIHYDFSQIDWDDSKSDEFIKTLIEKERLFPYFYFSLQYAMRLLYQFDQINQFLETLDDLYKTIPNNSNLVDCVSGLRERLNSRLNLIYHVIGTMKSPEVQTGNIRFVIQEFNKSLYFLIQYGNLFLEDPNYLEFRLRPMFSIINRYTIEYEKLMIRLISNNPNKEVFFI